MLLQTHAPCEGPPDTTTVTGGEEHRGPRGHKGQTTRLGDDGREGQVADELVPRRGPIRPADCSCKIGRRGSHTVIIQTVRTVKRNRAVHEPRLENRESVHRLRVGILKGWRSLSIAADRCDHARLEDLSPTGKTGKDPVARRPGEPAGSSRDLEGAQRINIGVYEDPLVGDEKLVPVGGNLGHGQGELDVIRSVGNLRPRASGVPQVGHFSVKHNRDDQVAGRRVDRLSTCR